MTESQFKLVLNPARMRIIQYLLDHFPASVLEIAKRLPDIPQASLYRHIKKLEEAGLLSVAETNQKRGAVEKKYQLTPHYHQPPETSTQIDAQLSICLASLIKEFRTYLKKPGHTGLAGDMLFVHTMSVWLTDEEFQQVLDQMKQLLPPLLDNQQIEGRKLRKLTLISSPTV